ncbi:unnamed protein product, partial [Effrenium voratum]
RQRSRLSFAWNRGGLGCHRGCHGAVADWGGVGATMSSAERQHQLLAADLGLLPQ